MQVKWKQATGTFFYGALVIGLHCCQMKRSYLTGIWGREEEDFTELCLVKPTSSKALLLCDSSIFLSHPLVILFQLEYHPVYEMATAFEVHFEAL